VIATASGLCMGVICSRWGATKKRPRYSRGELKRIITRAYYVISRACWRVSLRSCSVLHQLDLALDARSVHHELYMGLRQLDFWGGVFPSGAGRFDCQYFSGTRLCFQVLRNPGPFGCTINGRNISILTSSGGSRQRVVIHLLGVGIDRVIRR